MTTSEPLTRPLVKRCLAIGASIGLMMTGGPPAGANTLVDVALTGLPPLYEALDAVGNCPGLAVDTRRFRHAMASYGLTRDDLTPFGRFPEQVAKLAEIDRTRILDDRNAFCSAARLQYLVKDGILTGSSAWGRDKSNVVGWDRFCSPY